jgi:MerR family mercuric resistance operon transcriptional regulator
MMRPGGLSIGRLAALTGVHLETIRYYERIGLMPAPERTDGGRRMYADAHRRRLAFVYRARQLGFSLEDIRALLALSEPPRRSCREVELIAAAHLADVRAKIADLARLEALLATAVSCCVRDDVPTCPVLDLLEAS